MPLDLVWTIKYFLDNHMVPEEDLSVPPTGANNDAIEAEEKALGRRFSKSHARFLRKWNGIDLGVITLFGCSSPIRGAETLLHRRQQASIIGDAPLILGCSRRAPAPIAESSMVPQDFNCIPTPEVLYIEMADGRIHRKSPNRESLEEVAMDFEAFICQFVFGEDSRAFGGDPWFWALHMYGFH